MRGRCTSLFFATLLALISAGCAAPGPPRRCAYPAPPAAPSAGAPRYRYEVNAGLGAEELCVAVELPAGTDRLRAERAMLPFLRDVRVSVDGESWTLPAPREGGFDFSGCDHAPCRARYRVLLGDAAQSLEDRDAALAHRGALLAPASTWLLSPARPRPDDRFRLRVNTPSGLGFLNGLFPAKDVASAQEGRIVDLDSSPYAAFGLEAEARIELPDGALTLAMSGGAPALGRAAIARWIEVRARAVASYYGRFPVPHAALLVLFTSDRGIGGGSTMGSGGASVMLSLGERTSHAALADDWILVHELVHIAFPNVGSPWIEEGLATYVEPLIRVRAGLIEPDALFRDLLEGLPQGQPQPGDRGLEHTDTWGRRYWGGALFWFLADVAIRKSTNNARSLDDALRRIVAQGGNVGVTWTVDRALEEGDRDAGGTVLRDLRSKLGFAPVTVDLDALWNDLGVHLVGDAVVYDDTAKLAAIRKSIAARQRATIGDTFGPRVIEEIVQGARRGRPLESKGDLK